MITASHNPPAFNGFKLKASFAGSAELAECKAVEALLDRGPIQRLPFDRGLEEGWICQENLSSPYLRAIKRLVDFPLIARSRIRLAHDALFGVGAGCFDSLLSGTTCRVTTLNGAHDPNFGGINPEPIARNYGISMAFLRKHPHDLCVVTDGDADRVGGLDGHGGPLSTHQIICLLLHHFIRRRQAKGRVIKALTTTSMVDRICAEYGLALVETAVGFKHIAAEMLKGDVLLGFEESGGIGFPGHIPERDGILAGLMLLEVLATERKPIRRLVQDLEKQFGRHRYARIDTPFPVEKREVLMEYCNRKPPPRLLGSPVSKIMSFDGVKFIAKNGSWLMLRGSGTEPILRIYAEATSGADANRLLSLGTRITRMI
jgi:phosphomannomutase